MIVVGRMFIIDVPTATVEGLTRSFVILCLNDGQAMLYDKYACVYY